MKIGIIGADQIDPAGVTRGLAEAKPERPEGFRAQGGSRAPAGRS
jgi:hypothetical protein